MQLVIAGDDGGRDQNGTPSGSFQFRQRGRTGTADDQICRRQTNVHVIDVFRDSQTIAFQRNGCRSHCLGEGFLSHAAVAVNVVDRQPLLHVPRNHLCHCFVDAACSQTAAERKNAHAVIKAQLLPCCGSVHAGNAATHRQTGDGIRTVQVEEFQRLFHSQHHVVYFLCQHLVGDTGECVLLVNGTGNPHAGCGVEDRSCHIAAGANGNVRLELLQDLLGTVLRSCQIVHRLTVPANIFQRQLPLKACHMHGFHRIPRRRHQTCFHAVGRSHKQELCGRVMFFDD